MRLNSSDTALAYIGGFFDGEGSIGVYARRFQNRPPLSTTYYLRTQLVQAVTKKSAEVFEFLVQEFGGRANIHSTLTRKPQFNWQLNSASAYQFLIVIEPFLILKYEQARVAIEWFEQHPSGTQRNSITGKLISRNTPDVVDRAERTMQLLKDLKRECRAAE